MAAIIVFPILPDFFRDLVLGQIVKFTPRYRDQFFPILGRNASKIAVNIGVRLEKGNYPTLSAFFAQMATD
ncbi:hypothetical protein RY604_004770 [Escherichia coli]|nr:hypothetical protein [Escherichia coli]